MALHLHIPGGLLVRRIEKCLELKVNCEPRGSKQSATHTASWGWFLVRFSLLALLLAAASVAAQDQKPGRKDELQYYHQEFEAQYRYPVYDTLFEKILWERKVSHLLMDFQSDEYRVTLLVMQEYPWNYKGQTYPVYFAFKNFADAAQKFEYLNRFLRNSGVLAVGLNGSRIIRERILLEPKGNVPARPRLKDWPGDKTTDPILTREVLPRRLPLEKRFDSATSH